MTRRTELHPRSKARRDRRDPTRMWSRFGAAFVGIGTASATRMWSRFGAAFVGIGTASATLTLAVSAASADTAKVALVRDDKGGPVRQQMWTRLRAELAAAGFDVVDVASSEQDPRETGEGTAPASGVFATISLVDREGALDIWVADRITGKTLVRRVVNREATRHDAPAVLAVRAVELLRASLLEAMSPPPRTGETAPTDVSTSAPPAASTPPEVPAAVTKWMQTQTQPQTQTQTPTHRAKTSGFDLAAGIGLLHSVGGVGASFLPSLEIGYRISPAFSIAVGWGGPTFTVELPVTGGNIAVRQEIAWLEARYVFSLGDGVVLPFVAAAAGVYHLDVSGTAAPPYQAKAEDLFAAIWGGGGGAKIPLSDRVALVFDVHMFVATPRPTVLASGTEVADAVRPALIERAGIDVAF